MAQNMVRGPGESAFYVNRVGEVWGIFLGDVRLGKRGKTRS